ncbi:unnamed protein product [Absidia cylindrospora]
MLVCMCSFSQDKTKMDSLISSSLMGAFMLTVVKYKLMREDRGFIVRGVMGNLNLKGGLWTTLKSWYLANDDVYHILTADNQLQMQHGLIIDRKPQAFTWRGTDRIIPKQQVIKLRKLNPVEKKDQIEQATKAWLFILRNLKAPTAP